MKKATFSLLFVVSIVLVIPGVVLADDATHLSKGQQVYVPAYSHIYISNREEKFLLTVTLSIRNIDVKHPITITSVEYFDTDGKLIKKYLKHTVKLSALQAIHYTVPQKDDLGGVGANFLVVWKSDMPVNIPILESVMIGAAGQQGISFTSRGRSIITTK